MADPRTANAGNDDEYLAGQRPAFNALCSLDDELHEDEESTVFDPKESDIEFIRGSSGGSVHVLVPLRSGDDQLGETGISLGVLTSWFHTRTLCGRILIGARSVEAFADENMCMRCRHAMGECSYRLFEHPIRLRTAHR